MLFDKHLKNPYTYHISTAHERKIDHDCETINKIQIVDGELSRILTLKIIYLNFSGSVMPPYLVLINMVDNFGS